MRSLLLGLLVLATLGAAGSAGALCTCGDRDGCGSAPACGAQTPGDECGRKRSCKVTVGATTDDTCCCACSRGAGPMACNYGVLGAIDLPSDVACGSKALTRLATRTESVVNSNLERADAACRRQKNALKQADRARGRLARLRKKIEKAAGREKVDSACAAASLALLDAVSARIDDVEAGNPPGGSTTTTLPSSPSCAATFIAFTDPFEIDFQLGCFAAGAEYQGFQLTLGGGRQVTNFLEPPGFVCTITTESAANDSLTCAGNFNVDVPVMGGHLRTSPAPTSNMAASLFVQVGTSRYGPFPTTGP